MILNFYFNNLQYKNLKSENQGRTIYALSTPYGKSGIAVTRISGPHAFVAIKNLGYTGKILHRSASLCTLKSKNGEVIDESVVTFFCSPNSYTGEDTVEISTHGSIAVIKDLLKELSTMDILNYAENGEFTRMAFYNSRINFYSLEALCDLLNSETTMERKIALNQFSGQLNAKYLTWKNILISILSKVEAYIDFPTDDIPDISNSEILNDVNFLIKDIKSEIDRSNKCKNILSGIDVAIIGVPNSGKSTLINLITNKNTSIVSNIPGTTRDIISAQMEINDVKFIFHDTAGIRKTNQIIEKYGIEKSIQKMNESNIILFIIDSQKSIQSQFRSLFNIFNDQFQNNKTKEEFLQTESIIEKNIIVLINKSDLCQKNQISKYKEQIDSIILNQNLFKIHSLDIIEFSAINGLHFDKMTECLLKRSITDENINFNNPIITNIRQSEHLNKCVKILENISKSKFDYLEFMAYEIKTVVTEISYVIGEISNDDVLEKIFNSFCIGK